MRSYKARKDMSRLKEQYAEKIRKNDIALKCRIEKASSDYVDVMFLCE